MAYALLRIASVRDDAALLAQADLWATRAAREAATDADGAFYSRAMDMTPETIGRVSLFHTASGLHAVQALLARARGDLAGQQAAIGAFITAARQPCANFDLTLGRGSTLLGCVLLLDDLPDHAAPAARALLELGDDAAQALWAEVAADEPIGACPRIKYLGLAHGWSGLLYTQLLWSQTRGTALPDGLTARLDELAACAVPAGNGARWPWLVDADGRPDARYFMPGWCNGSAGHVFLWTLAHTLVGDERYLRCAEQAAWNAWEEPDGIGTLCCGAAGRAYALLNLWRHTGDEDWLARARELAARAAVTIRTPHARVSAAERPRDSLYKGEVGVALLLAELEDPAEARMPFGERNG
jgi:serine/threonine-protein kinase